MCCKLSPNASYNILLKNSKIEGVLIPVLKKSNVLVWIEWAFTLWHAQRHWHRHTRINLLKKKNKVADIASTDFWPWISDYQIRHHTQPHFGLKWQTVLIVVWLNGHIEVNFYFKGAFTFWPGMMRNSSQSGRV